MHWDSRGILCELYVKPERVKHCILKSLRVYGIMLPVSAVGFEANCVQAGCLLFYPLVRVG